MNVNLNLDGGKQSRTRSRGCTPTLFRHRPQERYSGLAFDRDHHHILALFNHHYRLLSHVTFFNSTHPFTPTQRVAIMSGRGKGGKGLGKGGAKVSSMRLYAGLSAAQMS